MFFGITHWVEVGCAGCELRSDGAHHVTRAGALETRNNGKPRQMGEEVGKIKVKCAIWK